MTIMFHLRGIDDAEECNKFMTGLVPLLEIASELENEKSVTTSQAAGKAKVVEHGSNSAKKLPANNLLSEMFRILGTSAEDSSNE
jgi:hypothetical protein